MDVEKVSKFLRNSQESNQAIQCSQFFPSHTWGFQGEVPVKHNSDSWQRPRRGHSVTLLEGASYFSTRFTNEQSKYSPRRPAKHRHVYFKAVKAVKDLEPPPDWDNTRLLVRYLNPMNVVPETSFPTKIRPRSSMASPKPSSLWPSIAVLKAPAVCLPPWSLAPILFYFFI